MPCPDCAEVKEQLNSMRDLMLQWFHIVLKKVESSESHAVRNTELLQCLSANNSAKIPDSQTSDSSCLVTNPTVVSVSEPFQLPQTDLGTVAETALPVLKYQGGSFSTRTSSESDLLANSPSISALNFDASQLCHEEGTTELNSESVFQHMRGNEVNFKDNQEMEVSQLFQQHSCEDSQKPSTSLALQGSSRKRSYPIGSCSENNHLSKVFHSSVTANGSEKLFVTLRCRLCKANIQMGSNPWAKKRSHAKAHVNILPFQCVHCSYAAKTKTSIRAHMQKLHADSTTAPDVIIHWPEYLGILRRKEIECFHS